MQQNRLIDKITLFQYSAKSMGVGGLATREQRLYFKEHIKPQIKGCRWQPKGWFQDLFIFPKSSFMDAVVSISRANIDVEVKFDEI